MTSRLAVEPWDPGYGAAMSLAEGQDTSGSVDVAREVPADAWTALDPAAGADQARVVRFVDGIRRIDARLWLTDERGTRAGLAASYAAGSVVCDGAATIDGCQVRRGLFSDGDPSPIPIAGADYIPAAVRDAAPETLTAGLQERMRDLEVQVVRDAAPADLVVVDGPLRGRQSVSHAIGYIKTHHVRYLPPVVEDVVPMLQPGQRTPLFLTQTGWSRWSWYLRLPHGRGHPWAGVVRCESSADLALDAARALADTTVATLPRFATRPHQDPRAPQNLHPIAGLERHLRRLLGDPAFLLRQLQSAAAG